MQHLHRTPLDQLFVIDIETVPCVGCHDNLDEMLRHLWEHKSESLRRQQGYTGQAQPAEPLPDHLTAASLFKQAGIYAEFGKVVCISVGYFVLDKEEELWRFRVKSFADHDEKQMLRDFADLLTHKPKFTLCAHNGKEFDFPYLGRRLLINGLAVPTYLDFQNMKPWETNMVDTFQYWRFGDYKNFTSLKLLAAALNVPSPKDDIDGSMVGSVFWKDKDLPRIAIYCQKDVVTVANIILRFKNLPLLTAEQVVFVN